MSKAAPDYSVESGLSGLVAGVDEAGRGPLAGPVVAAAVILDPRAIPEGLNDSKKLSEQARERLFQHIYDCAIVGVGIATVEDIDRINVLHATMLAMERAIMSLSSVPAMALIDGNRAPKLDIPSQTIVGGDAKSVSIAAASVIAKVTRDRMMHELHMRHPEYAWDRNKGYGTAAHLEALRHHGPTPHHRRSFAPVAQQYLL